MRIISGLHKGRRLIAPKNLPVRPTTDRQKESLFNILSNHYSFQDIRVLDLFSGTGNIAYEFASRGCKEITAIDMHYRCVKYISETNKELNFTIDIIKSDVFKYLNRTSEKFDVIFADPPYALDLEKFEKIPNLIFERNILNKGGLLIVEHAVQTDLSHVSYFDRERKYGSSKFSFFRKETI